MAEVLSNMKLTAILLCSYFMVFTMSDASESGGEERKCCCYSLCDKMYGGTTEKDGLKLEACQRGCRLFSLVLHVSHINSAGSEVTHASNGCFTSCLEGYSNPSEVSACQLGCSSVTSPDSNCVTNDFNIPHLSYYSIFVESDDHGLIQQGDTEINDVLNDPGLRKQFDRTFELLLDNKSTLPETHFRNLPVAEVKSARERAHLNLNCPKLYVSGFGFGIPQSLDIKNIKFMMSDLYIFVGVFLVILLCLLIAHQLEMRKIVKQMIARRAACVKYRGQHTGNNSLIDVDGDECKQLLQSELDSVVVALDKDQPTKHDLSQADSQLVLG